MKHFLLLLILAFLSTSCALNSTSSDSSQNQEATQADAEENVIEPSSTLTDYDGIVYPIYNNGLFVECESTIHDVKKMLGNPQFVTIEKFPNLYVESQIDEIHEFFFEGLNMIVYMVRNSRFIEDTDIILSFTLTGKHYQLPGDIKIGSSFDKVKRYIKPLRSVQDFYLYQNIFEGGYQEDVHFFFSGEKLDKVTWFCID